MKNKQFAPSLTYSYKYNNSVNKITSVRIVENDSGNYVIWNELLDNNSHISKKENFEKEMAIKVYQKMIEDLETQIFILQNE